MELDSQSSAPSSPSLSDIDEFYSAPSSPLMPGFEALDSLSQWPDSPRTNTITSNSSSSPSPKPHTTLPLIEGHEQVWKHPHQLDLDNSPFSKTENVIINNLRMSFFFYVDEAFPFNTSQIWSPFCQAEHLVMNHPSIGNTIIYADSRSSFPEASPQSKSVEHALPTTGIKNCVLNNVDMVYTAKNSSQSNPEYEYEQIKISAPFYKSKNIVLNNPIIQLTTVIKDGAKRHRCPPENISSPGIIYAPFYRTNRMQIVEADLLWTHETGTLFNCPCLLSSIGCCMFVSAHSLALESPTVFAVPKEQKKTEKHTNLPRLSQHSLTGVELDSIHRWPYPRCHARTRSNLRKEIISWLVDYDRKQDALWLHGDAGTGKTAVAQTVGEYADQRRLLWAAVFISRSKKLNDSTRIIPSISLQLAQHDEAYEKVVTKVIQDNPSILNINTDKRMQFKELVLEPFFLLRKQSPNTRKPLIVLDGLDEIDDKEAQSDLISLIAESLHPSHTSPSPFIWLLCSRPEPHLQDVFRRHKTQILYQSITSSLDDDDAHKDIERFFLEELHRIKEKHSNCFTSGTNQLGETDEFLCHVKSNSFLYASTLIRFICGPNVTNPARQLEDIVNLAKRPPLLSHSGSKYTPIDMLYLHILQMIPPGDEVLRLLGALTVSTPIAARYLAAIFDIPKVAFYSFLLPLEPVLLVPDDFQYEGEKIRFYHVSFPDFLMNPEFSGRFSLNPNLSRTILVEAQLRAIASPTILHSHTNQWYSRDSAVLAIVEVAMSYYDILIHAAKTTWDICSQISQPSRQWLLNALLNFDFQCLQDVCEAIPTYSFMLFLWWLRESVKEIWELRDLVRTSPKSDTDKDFVRACEQSHRSRPRKPIASPFPWDRDDMDQVLKEPRYVLAGMGKKTVLILLTSETVMVFLARDINDL